MAAPQAPQGNGTATGAAGAQPHEKPKQPDSISKVWHLPVPSAGDTKPQRPARCHCGRKLHGMQTNKRPRYTPKSEKRAPGK
eukprot:gene5529-biopygen23727